jgi:hypothetical protein
MVEKKTESRRGRKWEKSYKQKYRKGDKDNLKGER